MMPVIWRPATAVNRAARLNSSGRATLKPMAITSLDTAEAVRRCRKMSRSSTRPTSGASTNTDTTRAAHLGQPHRVWALKYIAAEM